jgi:1,4-dihydroxy-2-naphthoate octaprenyltransferase
VATAVPLVLGFVLAGRDTGRWLWGRFFFVLFGAFVVHLATNLANDLFDHLQGADAGESIGGSRVIQQGLIPPGQLAYALVLLYAAGLGAAAGLIRVSGMDGLWVLIFFSFISSLFYVAPPIRYGYRGWGEAAVFLNMGFVMVAGTYMVLAETWRWALIPYSAPVGFMVANILYYQSLPDMSTDRAVGKRTLAVRLGPQRAVWGFRLGWLAVYFLAGFNVAVGLAGPITLAGFASLWFFFRTDRLIRTTRDERDLDRHGHLVRKMYLIWGLALILGAVIR